MNQVRRSFDSPRQPVRGKISTCLAGHTHFPSSHCLPDGEHMMNAHSLVLLTILSLSGLPLLQAQERPAATIRAGMIGLDTSHVPAFTRILNNSQASDDTAGIKVVAGYPGGTDLPASRDRVARFTEQIR